MDNLKDTLLKEIHAGKVAMTPRAYFTMRMAALIALAIGILVTTVLLFNFIFFSIRINSDETLLFFGPRGFGAFLKFFPWWLLVIDIGLILLLQSLLRNFRFGYSIPTVYLIGALTLAAFSVGFVIDRATPFNDRLHEQREDLPPPVRGFFEEAHRPPPKGSGVCRCTVLVVDGDTLIVEDARPGEEGTTTLVVIVPPDNRRATTTGLSVGDTVFIAGKEANGVVQAFGIRKENTAR